MSFYIGTTVTDYNDKCVVAATCWFAGTPVFSTHGMSLPFMKEKLLSVVVVQNKDPVVAINAAAQRTIEKLYIRKLITLPPTKETEMVLLVPPSLKKNSYAIKHRPDTKHWLVRGAKRAAAEWIGAQSVKRKTRKRASKSAR